MTENDASAGSGSNFCGAALNQLLGSPDFASMPIFAKTRAPTNCWVVRTLPTLPFVLERLGFCINKDLSKVSSNFSTEEYRQRFRIKRRGVSPSSTLCWASCFVQGRSQAGLGDGLKPPDVSQARPTPETSHSP